jgi:Putative zinc-finger
MTCQIADCLGAYVLQALDPQESASVRAHLTDCRSCRDELASLSAVVSMLRLVTVDDIEQWRRSDDVTSHPQDPPPGSPAGGLTAASVERRPRKRRHRLLAGVIGTVIMMTAAGVTAIVVQTHTPPTTVTVRGTDARTHDAAHLTVTDRAWGSQLQLTFSGTYPGGRCSLIAHSRDGRSETTATWTANPIGTVNVPGATSIAMPELTELDVVSTAGEQLLRLTIPTTTRHK